MELYDIQILSYIIFILSIFVSILFNIIFVYQPIARIKRKVNMAKADAENLYNRAELIYDIELPKVDQILASAKEIEQMLCSILNC